MTAPEPTFILQNLLIWLVPYGAYFLGIVIRKRALPGENSPALKQQLLLGIPVGLVVVSPFLTLLRHVMATDVAAYLFNLGLIVEHGMLVQETFTIHLQKLLTKTTERPLDMPPATPPATPTP